MTATNRQLKAVTEALKGVYMLEYASDDHIAQAAIDASDAQYVAGLVEALKYYMYLEPEEFKAKLALQQPPEDLR